MDKSALHTFVSALELRTETLDFILMKKYLIGLGIIAVAGFLMIMPYILREISPPDQSVLDESVAQEGAVTVEIRDFVFSPAKISVKKGTSVRWINKDSVAHTITGDRGGPDSPALEKDKGYTYTFSEAGMFNYHCKPHPVMQGTVEVKN